MLLVYVKTGNIMYWHRLRTCMWYRCVDEGIRSHWEGQPSIGSPEQRILDMESEEWVPLKGLFG